MRFYKKTKINKVTFIEKEQEFMSKSSSENLNTEEFFEYLKNVVKRNKNVVIEDITDDNSVYLSTINTINQEKEECKIDEISELIKDYIRGNAVQMKAYSLTVKGELKGVFTERIKAIAKQNKYLRKGISEEDIDISEIFIQ